MILLRQSLFSISSVKRGLVGRQVEAQVLKEVPGLKELLNTKSDFIENSYPHNIEIELIIDKLNQLLPKENLLKEIKKKTRKPLNDIEIYGIEFFPFRVVLYTTAGNLNFKVKDDEIELIDID